MATKWQSTNYPGVRFREHPNRKHGIRKDRYFAIYYRLDGRRREEGLGWASEGWSIQKVAGILAKLKEAQRTGEGARTLEERRRLELDRREVEHQARIQAEKESIPFERIFAENYLPVAQRNKKPQSIKRETALFKRWIGPVIGDLPLKQVSPFHLEKIKRRMSDAGSSPRTILYALATIRQAFNFCRNHDLYQGDNPVSKVAKPRFDNRRLRYLTRDEAERLLEALAAKSVQVYQMAVLSLHCGLRAGEIFSLTWGDVDLGRDLLMLRDTKSGRTRAAFMTETVKSMLAGKAWSERNALLFPGRDEKKITRISRSFDRAVDEIGLNKGISDPRQRVVFHSLRHTYASWLVEGGVDLYTVKTLLGHATMAMTERYSHLGQNTLQAATKVLEEGTKRPKDSGMDRIKGSWKTTKRSDP